MSDYKSSLPVRTENDGDVVIKLADKTITSQQLAIDSAGNASVTVQNTASNPVPITGGNATAVNTSDAADGPVAPGTAASKSMLHGAQYKLTLPTLTDGQQAALQADSSGRLLVSQPTASALNATVHLQDNSGNGITSQANGSQRALDVGVNVAGVQVDPRAIRALTSTDVMTANQGAPNTHGNGWFVKLTDGTNDASLTASGEIKASITQPLPAGTNIIGSVKLDDGSGNPVTSQANGSQRALDVGINVAGVQVDPRTIRTLTTSDIVTANIKDSSGNPFSGTNPLPVQLTSAIIGSEVNDYNTAAAVASGASSNHDYPVTASKTFRARKFWATCSGRMKAEVQISTNGTTFVSKWVGFNSTACPNISIDLDFVSISDVGTGAIVRIIRTNLDKAADDLYSTISGTEV